jgi:TusE/DsrC/DsvC family sulfur relay protein
MTPADAPTNQPSPELNLGPDGYLRDRSAWTESVATQLAAQDGLQLGPEHFEIILFVQHYFEEFGAAPPMRLLSKAVSARLGAEKGNSLYLYQLFPDGPAKQASRYGGLPKPISCI